MSGDVDVAGVERRIERGPRYAADAGPTVGWWDSPYRLVWEPCERTLEETIRVVVILKETLARCAATTSEGEPS